MAARKGRIPLMNKRLQEQVVNVLNRLSVPITILDADSEVRNTADDLNFEGKIPISVRICIDAKSGDVIDVYQNDSCWDFPDRLGI